MPARILCQQLGDYHMPDDVADFWFGLSAIFFLFLDPLFLYVPLINEDIKCVMLDNKLKIAAIVLRSFGDLRYVVKIYVCIKRGLQNNDKEKTSRVDGRQKFPSLKEIAMSVAIDTVSILPVPHVRDAF
ncbi:hypothetical protein M0R45_036627 [Rubus argutus]|uniref:Uncharacterized protein n=1 Tax=Rubus argutus TaxID=59490 RepID=A0AAW1VYF8_RUBAR